MCRAMAKSSVERAPYIGVHTPEIHVCGHRPVDSLPTTISLCVRAAHKLNHFVSSCAGTKPQDPNEPTAQEP